MLSLFFEKTDSFSILPTQTFLRVSNNLDSHYYILEKVKNAGSHYFIDNYFQKGHSQVISYLNSWCEKEAVLQEPNTANKKPKQPKDKKSLMGSLLNKKKQSQTSAKAPNKQHKQEVVPTIFQDILYIQLQSFTQLNLPINLAQIKQFMALIYLLAMRVFQTFKLWPRMIPVITQSRQYKFIKKGKTLHEELSLLFKYINKQQKGNIMNEWSNEISQQYLLCLNQSQKVNVLGSFLQDQLQNILRQSFKLKVKRGQEVTIQDVIIEDSNTLLLKQSGNQLILQEYDILYYHQDAQTRQIIMENNIQSPIVLEGSRSNLLIRYLKQFVKS